MICLRRRCTQHNYHVVRLARSIRYTSALACLVLLMLWIDDSKFNNDI